jgi:hypothetical protein
MLKEFPAHEVPPLKISKTLKVPVLLDTSEMESLLNALQKPYFYLVQGICGKDEGILSSTDFVSIYGEYVERLKKGEKIAQNEFRAPFSAALSASSDSLYAIPVEGERRIIRAKLPVVQLQPNRITFSNEDKTFRTQLYGEGGMEWGVQFSYPLLYQDPVTQDILDVDSRFPNSDLFRALQRWIRHNTLPTPFIVEGVRMNVPIRLGKNCFSWIGSHPELTFKVHGAS